MNVRITVLIAVAGMLLLGGLASARFDDHPAPVIYVTSQDKCYQSIVTANLPQKGPFQLLEEGGPTGLQTEFGPGDNGYVGGRWKKDNGSGGYDYFSCPLLYQVECPS
jgi:hypothetical protein